jgi:hypothetical protein
MKGTLLDEQSNLFAVSPLPFKEFSWNKSSTQPPWPKIL